MWGGRKNDQENCEKDNEFREESNLRVFVVKGKKIYLFCVASLLLLIIT